MRKGTRLHFYAIFVGRNRRLNKLKVRDNCHLTRTFLETAHSKCNISEQFPNKVPVFGNNHSRCYAHLFTKNLLKHEGRCCHIRELYKYKEKYNGSKIKF